MTRIHFAICCSVRGSTRSCWKTDNGQGYCAEKCLTKFSRLFKAFAWGCRCRGKDGKLLTSQTHSFDPSSSLKLSTELDSPRTTLGWITHQYPLCFRQIKCHLFWIELDSRSEVNCTTWILQAFWARWIPNERYMAFMNAKVAVGIYDIVLLSDRLIAKETRSLL